MASLAVIGAGSFGTTLAHCLSFSHSILLYGRSPELVQQMKKERENKKYLPGISLSETIQYTDSLEEALAFSDWLIVAVPMQGLGCTLINISKAGKKNILLTAKGIACSSKEGEKKSWQTSYSLACQYFPKEQTAVLSGPNLAMELARGLPCATVIASSHQELAKQFQNFFAQGHLRVYTSSDVQGVCLGGALKNVYAIGAGLSFGFQLGTNALASYLCRALAEMARIFPAFSSHKETLFGLSGLGDLICTCVSPLSRNFTVGSKLSQGEPLSEILSQMVSVAEGVPTTKALVAFAASKGYDLPIAQALAAILFENASPRKTLFALLQRPLREEAL